MPIAFWLLGAELVLVEVSDRARVEATRATVPVSTLLAGRVRESRLALGRRVEAGEVLVVLDDQQMRLEREATLATLAGLRAQLDAVEREHAALVAAMDTYRQVSHARASEARASAREADVLAVLAASRAERSSTLAQQGLVPTELAETERAQRLEHAAGAAARRLRVTRTYRPLPRISASSWYSTP